MTSIVVSQTELVQMSESRILSNMIQRFKREKSQVTRKGKRK